MYTPPPISPNDVTESGNKMSTSKYPNSKNTKDSTLHINQWKFFSRQGSYRKWWEGRMLCTPWCLHLCSKCATLSGRAVNIILTNYICTFFCLKNEGLRGVIWNGKCWDEKELTILTPPVHNWHSSTLNLFPQFFFSKRESSQIFLINGG